MVGEQLGSFRRNLLAWFLSGNRDLPWRRTRDPYAIWVSETMLQQTRAAAAIPYFERFLARFPTVAALAEAPAAEVLAAWSGLGYYHRARNLHRSAQAIHAAQGFPATYPEILALPGVGAYTAAAVASIAFGLPYAVLDGNVLRVIARVMADSGDIGAPATRRRFQQIAQSWLDLSQPGNFNQAVMELGATLCLPARPQCLVCPVQQFCQARAQNLQGELPVKGPKAAPQVAEDSLVILEQAGAILLRRRDANASLMAGFWELPGLAAFPGDPKFTLLGTVRHTIVNTRWTFHISTGLPTRFATGEPPGTSWIERREFSSHPVTTVTKKALALLDKRPKDLQLVHSAGEKTAYGVS